MMKHIVWIMMVGTVFANDATYYGTHPTALQKVIAGCPQKQPHDISCDALAGIAAQVNELAYELQSDPQGYGKKILSLQEDIAKKEAAFNANTTAKDLKTALSSDKEALNARLAIVKWLASPGGH